MTIFDYVLLFILSASVIISLLRGLVREMLSLLGWVVAFVLANLYSAQLAVLLPPVIPGEAVRMMVAFVALFIGVRVLMGLLTLVVEGLVKASGLSLADRGLGAVFGLARGVVIALAAVMVCGMTALPQQPMWKQAMLAPMAEQAAHAVKPLLPQALAEHVQF